MVYVNNLTFKTFKGATLWTQQNWKN
jgi:hypothetical protein